MTNRIYDYKSHDEIPQVIVDYLCQHFHTKRVLDLPIEDVNEYLNMYYTEWPWQDSGVEQGL